MLALGMALVRRPTVLLLDEPTLGLAPPAASALLDFLRELRDREGTTVIVAEHSPFLLDVADTVHQMETGRRVHQLDDSDVEALRNQWAASWKESIDV